MRRLTVFETVSANGYFTGPGGDFSWAYALPASEDFQQFVRGNAGEPGVMLFGRVTYEMMKAYWPTAEAKKAQPDVAKGMNEAEKLVFSRTLKTADWATLVKEDPLTHVRALKKTAGRDLVVLGSGSLVARLAPLIDTLQLVVAPIALPAGKTLLEGVKEPLRLTLSSVRSFNNGNAVLTYSRAA
jgi:dihydrofolate reductase